MGVVKRIGQFDGGPTWILGLQPEMVEVRIAHEWQRDHLDEPGTGHGGGHPTTRLLGLGEATTASGTRQHRLHGVESALASHFLDVVERIDEIRAPCGWHQGETVSHGRHRDPGAGEDVDDLVLADVLAEDTRRKVCVDALTRHRSDRPDGGGSSHGGTAIADQQLGSTVDGWKGRSRVHTAFETTGCLRTELVSPVGASHRHGIEVGTFENDGAGLGGHLGGGTAHDSCQADRTGVVGDDEVIGIQSALDVVKGAQLLTLTCLAHDDGSGDLVGVVGVQGLSGLEHDVIRHVDSKADRTHPGAEQPILDESWRGCGRIKPFQWQGDEPGTGLGFQTYRHRSLDCDGVLHAILGAGSANTAVDVAECPTENPGNLASNPAHGHAVADVGGDIHLEDVLGNVENRPGILTGHQCMTVDGAGQHEDTGVVLTNSQFVNGTDHAVGHVTIGAAGRDLETARQDGSGQ